MKSRQEEKNRISNRERTILSWFEPASEQDVAQKICPSKERLIKNRAPTFGNARDQPR